jgi:hypothetical protein
MHFYDAALVNRDEHIITKLTDLKRKRQVMAGRHKAGITKKVQAMLRRLGL